MVLKELDADPTETIYVGDAITELQAAQVAKIRFAGVVYGSADPRKVAAGDFILKDPVDLLNVNEK